MSLQARVQELLGGGAKYFNHKWTLSGGGMVPRENFENRVVFLYCGAF